MCKNRPTVLVTKILIASGVAFAGFAPANSSVFPTTGGGAAPATGSYPPSFTTPGVGADANDAIANDQQFQLPTTTMPCAGGTALLQSAYTAANGAITAVNNQANRVGSEMRTKRSCIENINALISLSMPNFTSLSGIISKIAASIINAMINRACAAVVGAINGAVNTINSEIQGAKDQIMAPINGIKNQYGQTVGGGNQQNYVTYSDIENAVPKPAAASGGNVLSGSSQSSQARTVQPKAPAPAPTPAPAPSGWKGVSCKIFGGC